MSKKIFTDYEIKTLKKNLYVSSVSSKAITYTNEFKEIFVAENEKGKIPRQIFEESGFDTDILGMERVKSAAKRWRSAYKEKGLDGLKDTRKGNSGRLLERELSLEEKYARLEAQMNLVIAENELLKKIKRMERGW
jgi:transposase